MRQQARNLRLAIMARASRAAKLALIRQELSVASPADPVGSTFRRTDVAGRQVTASVMTRVADMRDARAVRL
jgi:hypothetical protein